MKLQLMASAMTAKMSSPMPSTMAAKMAALMAAALWLTAASASAFGAEEERVEDHPGYVDFSRLSALADVEPVVEVSLKSPLLKMASALIEEENEEAADLASKLLRVTVRVFEDEQLDLDKITDTMTEIAADLDDQGWDRVVRVRDGDEHVDIYFRLSAAADLIHGIAMMVAEPDEAVLVNIVGNISEDDIGALGRSLHIDELADYDDDIEINIGGDHDH